MLKILMEFSIGPQTFFSNSFFSGLGPGFMFYEYPLHLVAFHKFSIKIQIKIV